MVDASEIAFVTVFLASDKVRSVSGKLVAATGAAGKSDHGPLLSLKPACAADAIARDDLTDGAQK